MSRIKIIALISALALAAMACSLTSAVQQQVEDAAATQISDVVSPDNGGDNAPSNPDASGFVAPQSASDIHSFRVHMTYATSAQDGSVLQSMQIEGEYINDDPQSEHVTMTIDAQDGNEPQTVEYLRIGSQIWMNYAGQWMSINTDDASILTDFLPEASAMDTYDWEKIGKEKVNGVSTTHYRITEATPGMADLFSNPEVDSGDTFTFEKGQVDIYVTDDNVIIKQELHAEGEMQSADGSVQPVVDDFTFEVYDINAGDIVIEPPSGESAEALDAPLPVPDSATATLSSPGFYVYNVPDMDLDTAIAFYENNGDLTITSKMGDASSGYILMVQYDDQSFTLTLSSADNGGVDVSILGGG